MCVHTYNVDCIQIVREKMVKQNSTTSVDATISTTPTATITGTTATTTTTTTVIDHAMTSSLMSQKSSGNPAHKRKCM